MAADEVTRPAVDAIAEWFSRLFGDIAAMNRDFSAVLEAASDPGDDVTRLARAGRDRFKERVRTFLAEHPRVNGAGLIFSRAAGGEGRGVTEWWVRDGDGGLARYRFEVNPLGQRFYDYEKLEWFTMSFGTGRPWLAGPYIDYLGVEEYVVTLSERAEAHGRALGVAGLDITVSDLERELLPMLRLAPGPAMLLNTHGAVLVSTTSRWGTGDLVADLPEGFTRVPLGVAEAELSLVIADETARPER